MSAKVTGIVWESALERQEKYVLLALTDHCKEDGTDVYPSLWRIIWKTGYSETQVREIMRSLMKKKILLLVHKGGKHDGDVNRYRIDLKAIPMLQDFKEWSAERRASEKKAKSETAETAPSSISERERKPHPPEGTVEGYGRVRKPENEGTVATAPKPNPLEPLNIEQEGNSASELPPAAAASVPERKPATNANGQMLMAPENELQKPEQPKREQDPRFPEICDAIRKCWPKGDGYKCDITPADAGAMNRALAKFHDWTAEELSICIVARFQSASINPTESVKAWIGAITDYQSGPQGKFNRQPLYEGRAFDRWREQARVILYGKQPVQGKLGDGMKQKPPESDWKRMQREYREQMNGKQAEL